MSKFKAHKIAGFLILFFAVQTGGAENKNSKENEVLFPCQACKTVVSSLSEISKVGSGVKTENSEARLSEVKKKLCSDVQRGKNQCKKLAEEYGDLIDEWWHNQDELGDLQDWLCVQKVQSCCPDLHFGPECKPCLGYPDVCSNNGKCKGSGTRKGNGECNCNAGYSGPSCNECDKNYYESYRDEKKLLCSKCHPSCRGPCTKAGNKGCLECNLGWLQTKDRGCIDINECAENDPCKRNQFCVNNEGSYSCLACDSSCDSCHGDGPDMCNQCATGYELKDGLCLSGNRNANLNWARYLTYFGLCVATCIIFQKNTIVASIIGLAVAIYVTVSEYMLSNETFMDQNQMLQNSIKSFLQNNID